MKNKETKDDGDQTSKQVGTSKLTFIEPHLDNVPLISFSSGLIQSKCLINYYWDAKEVVDLNQKTATVYRNHRLVGLTETEPNCY